MWINNFGRCGPNGPHGEVTHGGQIEYLSVSTPGYTSSWKCRGCGMVGVEVNQTVAA